MHELILAVLKEKSPQGVTEIAEQIDRPRSTVDYYLKSQQSYFIKEGRKWRLPDTFDDLWDEGRTDILIQDLQTICNRDTINELIKSVENGETSRTQLLKTYKDLRIWLYEAERMIRFIELETTKLINNQK